VGEHFTARWNSVKPSI